MFRSRVSLLCLLLLAGLASGQKVLPGSPLQAEPAPRAAGATVPSYAPTTELLLDVQVLWRLHRSAPLNRTLSAAEASALVNLLQRVLRAPRLDDRTALALGAELRQTLGPALQARIAAGRAVLERQASLTLASSRLARDEGAPPVADLRLSFMVPGGQATVQALRADPQVNPFRQGVPATVLRTLMRDLGR